jgi:hypothetical protein
VCFFGELLFHEFNLTPASKACNQRMTKRAF